MRFNFTIHCKQDLIEAVQTFGIVPLFANSIPGFSVEEHCDPRCWFSDTEEGVWEWKGPVIRESGWGVAEYSTPEKLFGQAFSEEVYRREPEESRKRIFDQMQILHSDADVSTLMRFMR